MSDYFKEIPTFSEEQIKKAKETKDFMPLAFELFKSFGKSSVKLLSIGENTKENTELRKSLNFNLIRGLFMRINHIMISILSLSSEAKHSEIIFILQRCIFETSVNIMYLLNNYSEELFTKYIEASLAPEKELWDLIEKNITKRKGDILNIEESMLRSIENTCKIPNIDINNISSSHKTWGPSLRDKTRNVGIEHFYLNAFRIPSHAVHGSYVDLYLHYLEEKNGGFEIKDSSNRPDDSQLISCILVVTMAIRKYISYAFFDQECREALNDYFDEYEERVKSINEYSIEARHGKNN